MVCLSLLPFWNKNQRVFADQSVFYFAELFGVIFNAFPILCHTTLCQICPHIFHFVFFILSVTYFQNLFYGKNTTVVIFVIAGFLFAFRFLIKIIQKIIRDNLPLKFSFFLNFLFLLIQYLYNIVNPFFSW